jgi:hypothetical protein
MSGRGDELLKALGRVGREERTAADADAKNAPVFDEMTRERMAKRALEELGAQKTEARPASTSTSTSRIPRAVIFSALALAAAVALFIGFRRTSLPPYTLSVQGGTSEWRGEDASSSRDKDRIVVRADSAIEILLRPDSPVTERVQARAFAVSTNVEKALPIEAISISAQGVVRVAGRADELLAPEPREWTVVIIVVGDGDDLPTSLAAARRRDDLRRAETIVVIKAN